MPATITIRLKAWTGSPAGRTYIQGCQWDPLSKSYFIHQADDVGRSEQAIVIRRHQADGTYVGYVTFQDAGHGSSIGLEPVAVGHTRIWFGHATKGAGYVDYIQGQAAAPFVPVRFIPNGDISVDAANDHLCVRNGSRYRVYRLSAAYAGKAEKLAEFRIADWYSRFQGHLIAGGKVYVHRDVATKGKSMLRAFDLKGKKVGEWDTTGWGDEAEGAMAKDGWVYSVSRVGGSGPGRTVVCTPVEKVGAPPPPPPPVPVKLHGVDVSSYQPNWTPVEDDSFVFVKASEGTGYTNPSRSAQLAAARAKGLVVGHYHWLVPGNPLDQAAYFVRNADIRTGDLLWCDWEKQGDGSHPSIPDVAAFIAEVKRLVPTSRVGLYCNRSDWISTAVKAGDGLWIAEYGVTKPNTATEWVFWQYSDKPIDQNVSRFTSKADLLAWAKVK